MANHGEKSGSGLQDSSVDQLVRERPGCLLRSSDPEAELRYLVEAGRGALGPRNHPSSRFEGRDSRQSQERPRKDNTKVG